PTAVQSRITDAAEGNPLFLEEMFSVLVDDGVLRRDEGGWVVAGDVSSLTVPSSVQALLAARLDQLSEEERQVVERASVVGNVFYWGAVAELSSEDARQGVGSAIMTLVRKELIRPEPSDFAG